MWLLPMPVIFTGAGNCSGDGMGCISLMPGMLLICAEAALQNASSSIAASRTAVTRNEQSKHRDELDRWIRVMRSIYRSERGLGTCPRADRVLVQESLVPASLVPKSLE